MFRSFEDFEFFFKGAPRYWSKIKNLNFEVDSASLPSVVGLLPTVLLWETDSGTTMNIRMRLDPFSMPVSRFTKPLTSLARASRRSNDSRVINIKLVVPPGHTPKIMNTPWSIVTTEEKEDFVSVDKIFGELSDDEDQGHIFLP
ncbi:hypothetical protein F53441_1915 [Fusarium austroafricanum]|uniref:Uncharacterized protein n=1 Tax=Fusarium austroafricanum TaxID=2364996 RepID=A0A8H4NYE9_9HYPO|nr:hypothetical protein F53441_1915 [Fusarium austroafricanum]